MLRRIKAPMSKGDVCGMTATVGAFTSFRFSRVPILAENVPTDMARPVRPLGILRRTLSPLSDDPCHADVTVQVVGRTCRDSGVWVVHLAVTGGVTAIRGSDALSDGNDDVILFIQGTGRSSVSQLGQEAAVEPSSALLISNSEASTGVHPQRARLVAIGLPRKATMALVPGLEDLLMRQLPPDAGVLRLLMRYLDVFQDEEALRAHDLQRAVATHIQDLCALAIGATRDAAEVAKGRGLRVARLRAIKADIARNLEEGDVSALALAMRHRVTPRYIHKLFESEGATLSRFVLGQRLARVHRMLTDPRYACLTIGAIAYTVGFGDLSTFNREFRRHYRATPSDIRGAARQ
jgi:AraC-like DNA-binding protein